MVIQFGYFLESFSVTIVIIINYHLCHYYHSIMTCSLSWIIWPSNLSLFWRLACVQLFIFICSGVWLNTYQEVNFDLSSPNKTLITWSLRSWIEISERFSSCCSSSRTISASWEYQSWFLPQKYILKLLSWIKLDLFKELWQANKRFWWNFFFLQIFLSPLEKLNKLLIKICSPLVALKSQLKTGKIKHQLKYSIPE